MALSSPTSLALGGFLLFVFTFLVNGQGDYWLNGEQFCSQRYPTCCRSRDDNCSMPREGTLCYCDQFCDRKKDDCCPDYWTVCLNEPRPTPPQNITSCTHNGKVYRSQRFKDNCNDCHCEMDRRGAICEKNVCLVDLELIERINVDGPSRNLHWRAANYSMFWGHTLKEGLQKRLGGLPPRKMHPIKNSKIPRGLPSTFDPRGQGILAPIRDQGWCPTSWAISTADVASDRWTKMSKSNQQPVTLAPQDLVCHTRGQRGCAGGHTDRAWKYLTKRGLVEEECMPWNLDHVNQCQLKRICRVHHTGPPYRLGSIRDIMIDIQKSGSVQSTMRVYQDFFSYREGIYKHSYLESSPAEESFLHAVRIVGWGEEMPNYYSSSIKYWIVANSWGRDWGEDGYFRIVRGENECGIEDLVVSAWANVKRRKNMTPFYRRQPQHQRRRMNQRRPTQDNNSIDY